MKLIATYTLDDCIAYMTNHRAKEAYAVIGVGLWLLKANALHALPAGRPSGKKNCPTLDSNAPDFDNEGFRQWLMENICGPDSGFGLSRSSAYNYMQAAKNIGLTADDDDASLLALQERGALKGKKLTDLYKPVLTLENGTRSSSRPPAAPGDYWGGFQEELIKQFADESSSVIALYQMPVPDIEQLENRLRTALDTVRQVKDAVASGKPKTSR